jgi:hypothetical protein
VPIRPRIPRPVDVDVDSAAESAPLRFPVKIKIVIVKRGGEGVGWASDADVPAPHGPGSAVRGPSAANITLGCSVREVRNQAGVWSVCSVCGVGIGCSV